MKNFITDYLDIWTNAHKTRSTAGRGSNNKLNLHGIKKLRELILELAVRGKLVPQDASDEPASELLKKIAAEKVRLVKEGKIKKEISYVNFNGLDEIKNPLPISWDWIRLSDTADIVRGGSPRPAGDPKFYGGSIPFLKVGDITNNKGKYVEGFNATITEAGLTKTRHINSKTLLLSNSGATLGIPAICTFPTTFNDGIAAFIEKSQYIFDEYLYLYLLSISRWLLHVASQGQGQPNLNTNILKSVWFPLPPLAEQHRIVAKVDELMSFCDQIEQSQTDHIAAHAQLVETLLDTLTSSANHTELQNNWQRIALHFDTLFTTEHSVEQLKKTILQLAVMGKLVPQDASDEPASELLKKIAAEKARLVKEGKIKKEKPLSPISEDEKPFDLPRGWECTYLAVIAYVGTGGTPLRTNNEYYEPAEVNWVTSGETSDDFVSETKEKISLKAVRETNVSIYPPGTLIVAMYGQGKTRGQITELLIDAGTNQACAAIRLSESSVHHRKYIKLFFMKAYDELREQSAGGAQPNLNVGKIAMTVIPLPPLAEQHRIVAKVDELMILCDTLKTNLQNAQATQLQLADALVEEALN